MQPTGSYCPSDEKVSQIWIQVPLPVPDGCNSAAYFADLKQTFLQSYDEDIFFQMSVQGIGTPTWWLRGNVRLKERVHLKSTRKRVKRIMVSSCHSRHVLDPDLNTKFGDYLARELKVTSDTEQLSGESHWWTSWSLREHTAAGRRSLRCSINLNCSQEIQQKKERKIVLSLANGASLNRL